MNKKPKLTQAQIDRPGALPCPPGKTHCEYPAGDRSGLYLDVRPDSDIKSYYLRAKNQAGKSYSTFIGRANVISLKEAKAKVLLLKADIAKGKDLQSAAHTRKKVLIWNDYFDKYYLPYIKQHKRSWANDEEMHRLRIAPKFGNQRLSKFTRHGVQKFHNELKTSGLAPSTCDHHLKLIRQALNLAVDWDLIEANPVAKLKLFHVDNREERLLSSEDLRALMAAVDRAGDRQKTACQVVKFLLLTGSRVSESLHAKWNDIDRKNRTWTIQATNSKSKKRRSVPLNDAALEVLDQLGTEGNSDWLFINVKTGNRLTTIDKIWQQIRQDAGLPRLRLHDLRHMHASMLINSGQSLYVVQKILGHSDPSVTQRYEIGRAHV